MLRLLLNNLFDARQKAESPVRSRPSTYAELFDVMRYARGTDVMPFAVGYRAKPDSNVVDPTGPEPNFVLLDSEEEVDAFMRALNEPIALDQPGVVSSRPLHRSDQKPSTLIAEQLLVAFYYPDEEDKGWPLLQVFAIPPAMFTSGKVRPDQTLRNRYNFRQFPPQDKHRYVDELLTARATTSRPDVYIVGKLPVSLVDILNPRAPKGGMQ